MLAPDIYQYWNSKYKKDMAYQVHAENNQIADVNSQKKTDAYNRYVKNADMVVTTGDKTVGEVMNVLPTNNRLVNAISAVQSRYSSNSDAVNNIASYGSSSIKTGESVGDLKDITEESNDLPAPTYVSSDPNKPSDDSLNVSSSNGTLTYDASTLYSNNSVLNFNRNRYENVITKQNINPSDIISTFDGGVITQRESTSPDELSSYRLSSNDYLTQRTTLPNDVELPIVNYNHEPFGQDRFHHPDINSNVNTNQHIRYRYSYGFDNVIAAQMSIAKVAGYISSPINVSDCLYIELNADVIDNVEYSIIDGKSEVSILPIEQSYVNKERLFYGLMPRFLITDPNEIIVRHGEEVLGISSLEDLELFLSVNNTTQEVGQSSFLREEIYTIDYQPDTRAKIYYPKSKAIQVKIIQRLIGTDVAPASINSVTIRKHQNQSSWYLSSFDEDRRDYNPNDIRVY